MKRRRTDSGYHKISRAEVDRLLSEATSEDEQLGRFPEIVQALGRAGGPTPTEEEVQRFASQAAGMVPLGPDRPPASRKARAGVALWKRRRRLVIRLAGASAAVLIALSGFGGLAYAADGSIPGDSLYGVDLALEKIGIGDGGLKERLNEASWLVQKGRAQEGLDFAGDAIAQSAPEDANLCAAANALRRAAEVAVANQNLQTAEELRQTAERLRIMASGNKTNEELGQAVKDLVGSLGSQGGKGGEGGGSDQGQGGTTDATDEDTGDTGSGTTGTDNGVNNGVGIGNGIGIGNGVGNGINTGSGVSNGVGSGAVNSAK